MEDAMNRTVLLDPADTVILLLDHQNDLFQTVKDVPLAELRTNTVVLARVAKLAKIPLITTASVPDGPNGPLMHELKRWRPTRPTCPARARSPGPPRGRCRRGGDRGGICPAPADGAGRGSLPGDVGGPDARQAGLHPMSRRTRNRSDPPHRPRPAAQRWVIGDHRGTTVAYFGL